MVSCKHPDQPKGRFWKASCLVSYLKSEYINLTQCGPQYVNAFLALGIKMVITRSCANILLSFYDELKKMKRKPVRKRTENELKQAKPLLGKKKKRTHTAP